MTQKRRETLPDASASRPTLNRQNAAIALFFLACVVMGPSLWNKAVLWEEHQYVFTNPYIHQISWENLVEILRADQLPQFHPLVFYSYMVEWQLWKENPHGYHATNLLLFALTVVLVFYFLCECEINIRVAFWVAAVFAVHPLHVGSVAWIVERKDLLMGVTGIGALLAWKRHLDTRGWVPLLVGALLLGLAFLAKGQAVMLLAPVLWLGLRKPKETPVSFWIALGVMTVVACGVIRVTALQESKGGLAGGSAILPGGFADLLKAGHRYLFYWGKFLWPWPLLPLYPRLEPVNVTLGTIGLLAYLGGAIGAVYLRSRAWQLSLALLFLVATTAPILGFIHFNLLVKTDVSDHLTYLPVLGMAMLVAEAGVRAAARLRRPGFDRFFRLAPWAVIPVLGVVTVVQTRFWYDGTTLWAHTVRHNPDCFYAWDNLGVAYRLAGDVERSEEAWLRSLEIFPDDPVAHQNLGKHYLYEDRYEEAIIHLRRTTLLNPYHAESWKFLGMALLRSSHAEEAIPPLMNAVRLLPHDSKAHLELGTALGQENRWDEAVVHLRTAVTIEPGDATGWYNLACALASLGDHAEALSALRKAIEHGFRDVNAMQADPDLESLRPRPEFAELLESMMEPASPE